jgi:hypothetical protein
MKRKLALCAVIITAIFFACTNSTEQKKDDIGQVRAKENDDMVKRGEYIVMTNGCQDCHSPKIFTDHGPVFDSTRMLSGHPAGSTLPPINKLATQPGQWILMAPDLTAFVGPWGISYPANITSDSATGIGAWGQEKFIKTIRTGKHLGDPNGRSILPPMPWEVIRNMTDEDLGAIYAFLKTVPAINNRVPAPVPPNEIK